MAKEIAQQISQVELPSVLASRKVAGELVTQPETSLDALEAEKFEQLLTLLNHPELAQATQEGMFTIGIIKPRAHEGKNLPTTDHEAAEALLEDVKQRGINVVAAVNIQLTPEEAGDFYSMHRERPFYQDLVNYSVSTPVTYLVIFDPQGNAVSQWRGEIGSTHIKDPNETTPDGQRRTLRAQWARREMLPNNLFHGSDSVESATREIGALASAVKRVYDRVR